MLLTNVIAIPWTKKNAGNKLPTKNTNINSKGRNENTGRGKLFASQIPKRHNGFPPCWIFSLTKILETDSKSKMGFCPRKMKKQCKSWAKTPNGITFLLKITKLIQKEEISLVYFAQMCYDTANMAEVCTAKYKRECVIWKRKK